MQAVIASKTVKNLDLNFEVMKISPSIAQAWLEENRHNRKLRKTYVARLARDMTEGRWEMTGDAIRFDTHGALIDGQHRLSACVLSGVPFTSIVVYGLLNSTQSLIDSNVPRTMTDVFALRGQPNGNQVAAALRLLLAERAGRVAEGGNAVYTKAEYFAALERHPRLPLYIPSSGTLPRGISVSMVGYVRYVASNFCGLDKVSAAMTEVLKTGIPHYQNDPIHKWRERMLTQPRGVIRASRITRPGQFNALKSCFNKFARGEPAHQLRFSAEPVAIDGLNLKDL